jgi:hypothetical protein
VSLPGNSQKPIKYQIRPGNTQSLWIAARIARDVNLSSLPMKLNNEGIQIDLKGVSEAFGDFFDRKMKVKRSFVIMKFFMGQE